MCHPWKLFEYYNNILLLIRLGQAIKVFETTYKYQLNLLTNNYQDNKFNEYQQYV